MEKAENWQSKYCLQSKQHPQQTTIALCSFMEQQNFVDVAICCEKRVLHVHKVVLAANSALFKEELDKNSSVDHVVITGCEFSVVKSLVEFMYCGSTIVSDEHLKYLVAAARTLQMKALENLTLGCTLPADMIVIPKPQFLSKKPKYPAPVSSSNLYIPNKDNRKLRIEAEHRTCVKEAEASRSAIANLTKEIVSAPHANTFIIDETRSETTVENFISHPPVGFGAGQVFLPTDPNVSNNVIQSIIPSSSEELTADKIKDLLGNEANSSVKILFKTSDESFVTVTDEALQNLQKDGLQYQVIGEDEKLGDVQELQLNKDMTNAAAEDIPLFPETFDLFGNAQTDSANIIIEPCKVVDNAGALIEPENVGILSLDTEGLNESYSVEKHKGSIPSTASTDQEEDTSLDFSPDMLFAD